MNGRSATTCARSACARSSSAKRTCAPTSTRSNASASIRTSETGKLLIECGFEAFERDDGLHPESPGVPPERHAATALQPIPQRARLRRPQSLAHVGQLVGRHRRHDPLRLAARCRPASRPRRGRTFRNAVHDAPRNRVHRTVRRRAVVHPPLLHQTALAVHRAGAVSRALRTGRRARRPCAATDERPTRIRCYAAFQQLRYSQASRDDDVRRAVIPAYMGLIKQIDDELGKLFAYLECTCVCSIRR